MPPPTVKTELYDTGSGVTYEVLAYRRLSPRELVMHIRIALLRLRPSKRPKRGQKLTLVTIIGIRDD